MSTEEKEATHETRRRAAMAMLADPAKIDPFYSVFDPGLSMTEVESRICLALAMHRLAQAMEREHTEIEVKPLNIEGLRDIGDKFATEDGE